MYDFPGGSGGKVSAYNVGDIGSIPRWGRSHGEGNGNSFQYSCPPAKKKKTASKTYYGVSLVAQVVKCLHAMQETWV